jgi:hypothetical protein
MIPTVAIALNEVSQTAYVGPDDTGEVSFNGVVDVLMNDLTTVVVTLTSEDTWDSSVVEPSSLLFETSGQQDFSVLVRVPLGTSFSNMGVLTVSGRWMLTPGSISGSTNQAEGRIDIAQYFQFSIGCKHGILETNPGKEVQFEVDINNEGNFNDAFSVELLNEYELMSKGLELTLEATECEILEKMTETVEITVETPAGDSSIGEYYFDVKVWSEKGLEEGVVPEIITLNLKVVEETEEIPNTQPSEPDQPDIPDEVKEDSDWYQDLEEFASKYPLYIFLAIIIIIVLMVLFGKYGTKAPPKMKPIKIRTVKKRRRRVRSRYSDY